MYDLFCCFWWQTLLPHSARLISVKGFLADIKCHYCIDLNPAMSQLKLGVWPKCLIDGAKKRNSSAGEKKSKWVSDLGFTKHPSDFWVKKLWNDRCMLPSYWVAHLLLCMLTTESCKGNIWLHTLILLSENISHAFFFFFCFM